MRLPACAGITQIGLISLYQNRRLTGIRSSYSIIIKTMNKVPKV